MTKSLAKDEEGDKGMPRIIAVDICRRETSNRSTASHCCEPTKLGLELISVMMLSHTHTETHPSIYAHKPHARVHTHMHNVVALMILLVLWI